MLLETGFAIAHGISVSVLAGIAIGIGIGLEVEQPSTGPVATSVVAAGIQVQASGVDVAASS